MGGAQTGHGRGVRKQPQRVRVGWYVVPTEVSFPLGDPHTTKPLDF